MTHPSPISLPRLPDSLAAPADAGAGARPPLRIGLLVDGIAQVRWVEKAIRDIVESGVATIALVIVNEQDPVAPKGRLRSWYDNRRRLLFSLYERYDNRKFASPDDPFQPGTLAPLVEGVPQIRVRPRRTKHCDYFPDEAVDAIRAYDLDVAIRLGFRILKGRSLEIARHGVWSYHHGDNTVNRGGPPGFWEVAEGQTVTGSVLQILSEDLDNGRVIYRSYASTNQFSWRKNRNEYYWKASDFLRRKLRDLRDLGPEQALVDPEGFDTAPAAYSNRLYVTPTNREMARIAWQLAKRRVRRTVQHRIAREQWVLGYRQTTPTGVVTAMPELSMHRFQWLVPPADRFWADPFPVRVGRRTFIIFEEYLNARGRAHISVLEMGAKGPIGEPVPVLERDYHLSYPFVFEWEGSWYMIPECAEHRTLELYRATEFPFKWELDRVLFDGVWLMDATLAQIGDRWWMFANGAIADACVGDELYLFHAPTPLGPWTAHRRNPVVSDVRHARPAGRIFCRDGVWYRPAQNSAVSYGHSMTIQRIVTLTPDCYEEREVSRILPDWAPGLTATHTINAIDGLTVIDARLRRRG